MRSENYYQSIASTTLW